MSLEPLLPTFKYNEVELETLPVFINHLGDAIKELAACQEQGAFGKIRDIGHKLKGSARAFGFAPIAEVAEKIEEVAQINPHSALLTTLREELETLYARVNLVAKHHF